MMSNEETTRIFRRSGQAVSENLHTTNIVSPSGSPNLIEPSLDPETRLFRPKSSNLESSVAASNPGNSFSTDPVVGWLAIIDGPGKVQSLTLGFGMNSIGRGKTNRIQIDFGDELISRDGHASLTYDQRHRKFYLQHGGGSNLTYCNETPVLAPMELFGREKLAIGASTLVFVPFCNPEFGWD
jgi:hypothetical protein